MIQMARKNKSIERTMDLEQFITKLHLEGGIGMAIEYGLDGSQVDMASHEDATEFAADWDELKEAYESFSNKWSELISSYEA